MKKFYSHFVSKKVLVVLLSFISVGRLWATDVSGIVSGTWDITGSPYVVIGDITVSGTLIIKPGVTVNFSAQNQTNYSLSVLTGGKLIAKGTADSAIMFIGGGTSLDGYNGRYNKSGPVIIEGSNSVFDYVIVDGFGVGYNYNAATEDKFFAALEINTPLCTITNCTIKNTRGTGLLYTSTSTISTPSLSYNTFSGNYVGLQFNDKSPVVSANSFSNNFFGTIPLDVITGLDNLQKLVNNDSLHIGLTGFPMTLNDTITSLNYDYRLMAILGIEKILFVKPGSKVIFPAVNQANFSMNIVNNGKLIAKGNADTGILFIGGGTSLDGYDGRYNKSGPINIGGNNSVLDYVTIDGFGVGYNYSSIRIGALDITSSTCSLTNCTIQNTRGTGVLYENSNLKDVTGNTFSGNNLGLRFENSSGNVDGNTFFNNSFLDLSTELDNLPKLTNNSQLHIGLTAYTTMSTDDIIVNYNYDYRLLAALTVPIGRNLSIEANSKVVFPAINQQNYSLDIKGTLLANGSLDNSITFQGGGTSLDGYDGRYNKSGPVIIEGSNSILKYVIVDGLGVGYNYTTDLAGALDIRSNCTSITNCTIQNTRGTAIVTQNASPYISGSCFLNNTGGVYSSSGKAKIFNSNFVSNSSYGIKNASTADTVIATNCWWNSILGPTNTTTNPVGGDIVSNYVLYTPFSTNLLDCSELVASNIPDCSTGVLPLTLLNFQTTLSNNAVNCTWQTATETNTSYFIIQRSTDGANFSSLGKVYASGNSSTNKTYSFTDKTPNNGINYYRLQMVDKDGKYSYSKTLPINISIKQPFAIYPNPVKDVLYVQVQRSVAEQVSLQVIDIRGKMIAQQSRQLAAGVTTLSVNTTSLAKGSYFVVIKGQTTDKKLFIKE